MLNTIIILIAVAVGIRVLPILDALVDLINHYIAIQVQYCEIRIRDIAMTPPPEGESHTSRTIGFDLTSDTE